MAYLLREGNTACNASAESARAKAESKTGNEVRQRLDQSAEDKIRFRISRIPVNNQLPSHFENRLTLEARIGSLLANHVIIGS